MTPSRSIPTGSPTPGAHQESIAGLASSFAASLADPSPLAQEVLARDIAELTPSEIEAENRAAALAPASYHSAGIVPYADGSQDDIDTDSDIDGPGSKGPYLYRRPSAIAYGNTRPVLGVAPTSGPALSKVEKLKSREAERSLLRDNHLLPPKHVSAAAGPGHAGSSSTAAGADGREPGLFTRVYKSVFSTRRPKDTAEEERRLQGDGAGGLPDERTALLETAPSAPEFDGSETGPHLDEQWNAAVAAGQIHTTWQREAKTIAVYSRSLIITFLLQYSINITGVFAVGHIGKAELGAVSLATMTASITFYAPCQGLATCLDTLCSQAYGSGHKFLVGLQLQRMCCFLLVLCIPLAGIWFFSEEILVSLVPEPEIAALAGLYLRVLVISMPASAVFECSKRYMQAQGLFTANTYVLLIAAPMNIFLNWLFVWQLQLGFIGAPISAVITQWTMPLLLLLYVYFVDGAQCWGGFTWRIFSNWGPMIKLALPGMIMVEAEFFAFEILTLGAGRFGSTTLAAQSILVTLTSTTYQLPFPMSVAASTRIANLIGAKLPIAAKTSANVATAAGVGLGLFNCLWVFAFRYQVPRLFTSEPDVIELVAQAIPVVAVLQIFDGTACVASSLLRGVGRQEIGSYANLAAYYIVALPISFATAFSLGWELRGLWAGVGIGLFLVTVAEYTYLYSYNWDRAVEEAEQRNLSG
ncbi:multidrug resistance protein, MATE family [Sporothrix schenckii 1099-18]|uniref:Multidrug resistance protein, MATE family n=1 Tax=Sporothrix schenckii 1099-18 TaxID=1397361 RepID=A0A0F2M0J8_SPOSC|nr:multidrug resistance protein, MATE family [Sporothrix schenckii 1099-18]KJR82285.1 multidrug resistance protein, MATE family [Sporothrix schenckii 1099-18]